MEAVTTSMFVLLLISGLGLSGASYNTCKDTLINNGFSMSDSAYYEFYQAANEPDNIVFINNNQDYLSEQWSSIQSESVPTTPPDYDHDNVESVPLYPPYADPLAAWYFEFLYNFGNVTNDIVGDALPYYAYTGSTDSVWSQSSETQSVTVWTDDLLADAYLQQYGKPSKAISDGHGGYYQGVITSNNGYISYDIYHFDSSGGRLKLFSNTYPATGDYYHYNDFYIEELADGSQVCHYVQDIQFYENSDRFTRVSDSSVISFPDERTEEIEEKKTGEQTELTINPDGSITLPDGTLVYPNADGTYTINGTDYAPSTVIPNINDLLQQLLDLQQQIDDLKFDLTIDNDTTNNNISEAVDEAVGAYEGDFSEFLLNSRITQVFPFCLPFDFVRGLKLLSSSPVAPSFDIDFNIPAFGAYPGTSNVISLDLEVYSKYFTVVRWVTTILFIISLCFLTYKLIKW